MPFNESTSKKEVQNTALTMERTWGPLAWIFCVFVSFVFILFFPDKVRVRDAGEKLPHSLKAHRDSVCQLVFLSFYLLAKLQRKLFSCELEKMNFKLHWELENLKSSMKKPCNSRIFHPKELESFFLGLWNGCIINCDNLSYWIEGCNKSEGICSGLWLSKIV